VYRGTTSGSLSFLVKIGNVLTFTDAGLTNGQAYYYQVAAISGVGESPRSAQVSATPAVPPLTSDFVWTVSGRSVTFTLSALGGTPPYRFRLTYGDGANSGWTTTTQLSHAYANAGQYKVVLTVSDAAGRQVTKTKYVTVA
jgi:PKD repeat protein